MTIKEAIGTYRSNHLTSRYHKLAMLGAPKKVIEVCRTKAKKFSLGQFIIHTTHNGIEPGAEGKTWNIDTYADPNTEDTLLSNATVIKIEGARGHDYYDEPQGVLKLTTTNNIYYYDSEEVLSTDISKLLLTIDEEFEEITL